MTNIFLLASLDVETEASGHLWMEASSAVDVGLLSLLALFWTAASSAVVLLALCADHR